MAAASIATGGCGGSVTADTGGGGGRGVGDTIGTGVGVGALAGPRLVINLGLRRGGMIFF